MLRHLLQMPWHLAYQFGDARMTRRSATSRDVFLIPKISYIIRHCKFVSQGACIFLKKQKNWKRQVLFELEKEKTWRRKNLSLNRVFHKLDNNKWKMHTGARAREQKYISIYISLCMKTFLKTGVYIYIYIYIYIYTTIFLKVNCFIHRLKVFRSGELLVSSAESSRWK